MSSVSKELLGSGTGSTPVVAGSFKYAHLIPGTLLIQATVAGTLINARDDAAGGWMNGLGGSISYESGLYEVIFGDTVDAGTPIYASYNWNSGTLSSGIGPCNCPLAVISTLDAQVYAALQIIQRVKHLTKMFNNFFLRVLNEFSEDLSALATLIPIAPTAEVRELLAYFTCPLTPLALAIDPSLLANIDPRSLWYKVQVRYRALIQQIEEIYDTTVGQYKSKALIALANRYLDEVYRAFQDAWLWPVMLTEALAVTSYVSVACPALYYSPGSVYVQFENEIRNWSFDGVLPSGLDPTVVNFIQPVATAKSRLLGWKALLTVVV